MEIMKDVLVKILVTFFQCFRFPSHTLSLLVGAWVGGGWPPYTHKHV